MKLEQRIRSAAPKKILALDGGGIRGMISVEILFALESMLRRELRKGADFVLADYFDFVAGTSTGAIIAACIALGFPMEKIRKFYLTSGEQMFDKASLLERLKYKYESEPLTQKLQDEFGIDTALGSDKLRCLLMMVLRNATTDSPWPISNNPFAKYNQRSRSDCNLDLPLWQLVRASTAAPVFFPPEVVSIGSKTFIFVDGGVTMYNNPAFHAFLMATTAPFGINWATGAEKLLVVSVGTGVNANAKDNLKPSDMHLLYNASSIPGALMNAAKSEQDWLCRVFGDAKVGLPLDRELGDMLGQHGPGAKLFTYLRLDADVTHDGLAALGLGDIEPKHVQELDSVEHVDDLQRVGQALAARYLDKAHLTGFL
jgi:patatin-like phospholipase/acyl hydrolase